MRKRRVIFIILLVMATLDTGIFGALAETPSSPNPGSNEDQYSPSKLAEKDKDFKKIIDILGSDHEYNRLGLTDAQWNELVKTSVCYPMAWPINHPDVVNGELTLGRPQLQLVLDINAIENAPKGTLLEQLTSNADLNRNLKNVADYTKFFLKLVTEDNPLGLALDLLKHAAEKIGALIKTSAATDSFNNVYKYYKPERDQAPNADPKSILENMGLDVGAHKVDYSNIREFYLDLNKNANLGWNSTTTLDKITAELSFYLESRYKSEKGALDPWDAPITKPEDAIENQIRDVTHAMKIQLNKNLRKLTRDCMNIPNIEGSWKILQPIQADMELVQSDNTVKGTYHNSDVQGTIEGTLTTEGSILTGTFADQKSKGNFSVAIAKVTRAGGVIAVGNTMFYGNWKYFDSQGWDGVFEGVKNGTPSSAGNVA